MDTLDLRHDLIEACKRYDHWAQKTLYEDYADAMYNVACRIVLNKEDAQDVLQNAFIDVFRNLSSFKYESTPGAWIKRIVINKALTLLKKKKKLAFIELEERHSTIPEIKVQDSTYDIREVRIAIDNLPDGYRTVLTLYLIEGYDHKEIGEILGISHVTSKSQFSRAKQKLREILSNSN